MKINGESSHHDKIFIKQPKEDKDEDGCDYCGKMLGYFATVIDIPQLQLHRKICIKCFVKAFDVVLGEPKK